MRLSFLLYVQRLFANCISFFGFFFGITGGVKVSHAPRSFLNMYVDILFNVLVKSRNYSTSPTAPPPNAWFFGSRIFLWYPLINSPGIAVCKLVCRTLKIFLNFIFERKLVGQMKYPTRCNRGTSQPLFIAFVVF